MSDDKIEEIRARHVLYPPSRNARYSFIMAYQDIAALLAEVDRLRAEVERLREALLWYANPRNNLLVEGRRPGDPDPAVALIEWPPVLSDGGRRAREALEGEP